MTDLTLDDASIYVPDQACSSSSSDTSNGFQASSSFIVKRMRMNEFLNSCNYGKVGTYKKKWEEASVRTRNNHVSKAKDIVVAGLNVIAPGDAGHLWEALKASNSVEKALGTTEELPADRKYLEALAETYQNASNWETRRQVLSIMADIVTFKRIQYYLPGLTEYRIKIARRHRLEYGRGVPLPPNKSTRMRVDQSQLDHFLTFITSSHVVHDLPFGQRYLRLSSGKVLETPNVIRTMIPNRLVKQYQQYCKETAFKPFGHATMLRILSACSATVRKSLQGLDYFAADGAKAFDDLCRIVERLEECVLSREIGNSWERSLKAGKQYLKSDYKVKKQRLFLIANGKSREIISLSNSPFSGQEQNKVLRLILNVTIAPYSKYSNSYIVMHRYNLDYIFKRFLSLPANPEKQK
jgi:hypothetical protein